MHECIVIHMIPVAYCILWRLSISCRRNNWQQIALMKLLFGLSTAISSHKNPITNIIFSSCQQRLTTTSSQKSHHKTTAVQSSHQLMPTVNSCPQQPPTAASSHHLSSVAISSHQQLSEVISRHKQHSSVVISTYQRFRQQISNSISIWTTLALKIMFVKWSRL